MIDADRAGFAETLGAAYELYGRSLSAAVLEIWWETMRPLELAAFREALGRHALDPDSGQYPPKPADIVRQLGGTTADASMLAWAKVNETVRRVGTYQSVVFDDPIIHLAVRDLGGWMWFGSQTEDEWPFVEKRFRDAYRAYRNRGLAGLEVPTYLAGRIATENGARGYHDHIPAPILIGDKERATLVAKGESMERGKLATLAGKLLGRLSQ